MSALFFTHAGPGIGGGHLSRCSSLAEALRREGMPSRWVVNAEAADLLSGASVRSFPDPFAEKTLSRLAEECREARFAVVDSYAASLSFVAALSRFLPVVLIDDEAKKGFEDAARVVLNHNIGAEDLPYRDTGAKLLLGPRYALLRPAFWHLEAVPGEDVLFVAGASDPFGVTERVVSCWESCWLPMLAVCGPLMASDAVSRVELAAQGRKNVAVLRAPENLPQRMAKAGLVICTSSVTSLEALALRKPLAVFQVAENQRAIGAAIARQGLGVNLGAPDMLTAEAFRALLRMPPAPPADVVDARGALHAARRLREWFLDS